MIDLKKYGISEQFERQAAEYPGMIAARVTELRRGLYRVVSELGETGAVVLGKFAYSAHGSSGFPAVGDWVMIDGAAGAGEAVIHHILRRKSALLRQAAGVTTDEQLIAANIDVVFICVSLNEDFNLRRIERYLTIVWDSSAVPVIVLTKSDLCADLGQKLNELASVSMGADVAVCSAQSEDGIKTLQPYILPGATVAFVGSSGAGKSTLINRLAGEEILKTGAIREGDGKGRHTTSHRQLLPLPNGGIVIDTPGMRELQIHTGNVAKAFGDVEELAARCKYRNCSHGGEPDCEVRRAIEEGFLPPERFESYLKLRREVSYAELNARALENEKIKRMFGGKGEMKQMRDFLKDKRR